MRSKIGGHQQVWAHGSVETAQRMRSTTLKVLTPNIDEVRKIHETAPLESLVLRHFVGFNEDQSHFIEDASGVANFMTQFKQQFDSLINYAKGAGIQVYGEGLNEVNERFMWEYARKYNDFTVRFAQAMQAYGVLPLGYSWYPGNLPGKGWVGDVQHPNPQFETFEASLADHWSYFIEGVDACVAAGGGIALHAYGGDSLVTQPWREWYILRYRKDWAALALLGRAAPPTFLTEIGIDRGFIGVREPSDRGWRKVPLTEQEYTNQLLATKAEFDKDPMLKAAHIFLLGAQSMWSSFDVNECYELADALGGDMAPPAIIPSSDMKFEIELDPPGPYRPGQKYHVKAHVANPDGSFPLVGGVITTDYGWSQRFGRAHDNSDTFAMDGALLHELDQDGTINWNCVVKETVVDLPCSMTITVMLMGFRYDKDKNVPIEQNAIFPPLIKVTAVELLDLPPMADTPVPTPRDTVFYGAGRGFNSGDKKDARWLYIQQVVNAMGGPTMAGENVPIEGDPMEVVFHAAGDGFNQDNRLEWLTIQGVINDIKVYPDGNTSPPR